MISVDIKDDGQGDIPVESMTIGRKVSVEVPMTRSSWTQLEAVIHGSVEGTTNLAVPNSVGELMFASAEELVIKPKVNNVTSVTTTEWIHVFKTYPKEKMDLGFDLQGQRIVLIEFVVFPDDTSGNVGQLWRGGPVEP